MRRRQACESRAKGGRSANENLTVYSRPADCAGPARLSAKRRSVSIERASRTREYSATCESGKAGRRKRAPTSTSERGATRRASGHTASPAAAASATAATPPPVER